MGMLRRSATASVTLQVTGMTCGNCQTHVTHALTSLKGVTKAKVQLQGGKAEVAYDPSQTDLKAMIAAVEDAGYKAVQLG